MSHPAEMAIPELGGNGGKPPVTQPITNDPVPRKAPVLTSVTPPTGAAGQPVTIVGTGFGLSQGSGYVCLSNAGENWGLPGSTAALEITSWSETVITFMVPEPSGPAGKCAVQPGTTATVLVAVPGSKPNTMLQSNPLSLIITAAPVIFSISVPQAGPGTSLTLNGQRFGAQQGTGYVLFSDNGAQWGAPGNAAALSILNWSDTQITFVLPMPSGGQSATPGTTADVTVTNSASLTSNPVQVGVTSGVRFPVTADSGDTRIGRTGDGHMDTFVTIEADGSLTAMTHIWDTDTAGGLGFLTGFHGAAVVTIFDSKGNQLDQWNSGPIGVEGGQNLPGVTWGGKLTATDLACLYSVSVVNFYDPQYSAPGSIAAWIVQNGPAIATAASTIAGAF